MTYDRTGERITGADACDYCDRDPATCRRIPGRCCGACSHGQVNESAVS